MPAAAAVELDALLVAARADPVLVNEYLAGDTGLLVLLGTGVCAAGLAAWAARRRQLMQTVSL